MFSNICGKYLCNGGVIYDVSEYRLYYRENVENDWIGKRKYDPI